MVATTAQQDSHVFGSLLKAYTAAWSFRDGRPAWENIERLYRIDGQTVYYDAFEAEPLIGFAAMKGNAERVLSGICSLELSLLEEPVITMLSDAIVLTLATLRFETRAHAGSEGQVRLRATLIWQRDGSQWLISHEHVSGALD